MAFAAEICAYQVSDDWRHPTELCMAEGVLA